MSLSVGCMKLRVGMAARCLTFSSRLRHIRRCLASHAWFWNYKKQSASSKVNLGHLCRLPRVSLLCASCLCRGDLCPIVMPAMQGWKVRTMKCPSSAYQFIPASSPVQFTRAGIVGDFWNDLLAPSTWSALLTLSLIPPTRCRHQQRPPRP